MIIIHHFLHHVIPVASYHGTYAYVYPFFVYGVNLFFMISGWFGINLSLKSFTKIVGLIFLFTIINNLLHWITLGFDGIMPFVKYCLFPITFCHYWFIKVYVLLMLTAPLINSGLKGMSLRQLRGFMIIFSIYIFYSCGLAHNYNNPDGYRYVNALYLYCLAHYLRHDDLTYRNLKQYQCIAIFVVLTLVNSGLFLLTTDPRYFKYSNLPVIVGAAAILIFFSRLSFQSKIINTISGAALGCYLLQDGKWGTNFLYPKLTDLFITGSVGSNILLFCGVFTALWVLSMILTPIFNKIIGFVTRQLEKIPIISKPFIMLR